MITIDELRRHMFSRADETAFKPLTKDEINLLEKQITYYKQQGIFHICNGEEDAYKRLRTDHLNFTQTITAEMFRNASEQITRSIVRYCVSNMINNVSEVTCIYPWRAALAFADAFYSEGIRSVYHVGASRNEETLETEIYFEQAPENDFKSHQCIIADPMLATGNTMVWMIEKLKSLGVNESSICVVSLISAPEGVDHVLSKFPQCRVITGNHDHHLNENGFIVPGLGDFGDKYFEDFPLPNIEKWAEKGIINLEAKEALLDKLLKK